MICVSVSDHVIIDLSNSSAAESSFYMVGSIDDARAKGEKILAEL
jgi:hypothetical protein